jgi:hypothetical protein
MITCSIMNEPKEKFIEYCRANPDIATEVVGGSILGAKVAAPWVSMQSTAGFRTRPNVATIRPVLARVPFGVKERDKPLPVLFWRVWCLGSEVEDTFSTCEAAEAAVDVALLDGGWILARVPPKTNGDT